MAYPYKLSASLLALLGLLAACSNPSTSSTGAAGAPPAATLTAARTTPPATTPTTVQTPTPTPATAAPSATAPAASGADGSIACGKATCKVGAEVCCEPSGKPKVCKPVAAGADEKKILAACGTREQIIAKACDDSSDCPGERLCCMPMRHGSDASFGTYECVAPKECDTSERCVPGTQGTCKTKGMTCSKSGICAR